MIHHFFIMGTSAEMIKMKFLVSLFDHSAVINTKQQNVKYSDFLIKGVNVPVEFAPIGKDDLFLSSVLATPKWVFTRLKFVYNVLDLHGCKLRKQRRLQFVYLHGDTLTSGVAAFLGRIMGFSVVHIEAGLRSGSLLSPFPEELTRLWNSFFSTIHFAPDQVSFENLKGVGGQKFNSGGNTFIDSMPILPEFDQQEVHPGSFILVHLHRLELLKNKKRFYAVMRQILTLEREHQIMVVGEPHFLMTLKSMFSESEIASLILLPKMERDDFLRLCIRSEFVITDSGGTQEELALLGIPTLIHRRHTERVDGIGENIILSNWDINKIAEFSSSYILFRRETKQITKSPSAIIHQQILKIQNGESNSSS
jgi:UDP-N-acetylglucosamine 2-epimerase (non-hydrolysing)